MQQEPEQSATGMALVFHDVQTTDYVPHHFIEDQSKMMMNKNASSPGAVDTNKTNSPAALDLTQTPLKPLQEKMEYLPVDNAHKLTTLASESCGPTPCTYTCPFIGPDVFDPNQFKYCHSPTNPAGVPLSDPLSLLPTTGNWPKSESMDLDDGYIALPVGGASPYIHAITSFGSSSLDRSISCGMNDGSSEYSSTLPAHSRNASAPELCSMSQEIVSPSSLHDCLQARSRKPIMQDFPTSILDTEQDMSSSMSSPFFRRGSDASIQVRPSSKAPSSQSLAYSRSYDTIPADDNQSQSLDAHKARCQAPSSHPEPMQTPASKPPSLEIGMTEVPGWCPGVTDRTINQIMSKYINDDGNFIVWYYSARKTHVITVSHMGIRHYAVHNKTVAGDQAVFYIFEGGFESTSLASLIKHYMRNGLAEPASTMLVHGVNDPTKKFTTPEESSGSRGSRNRLSHVKLKRPLVVRYGNSAVKK
ncbi:uncharacterized protein LOC112571684 isoform X2 [Pomacea canaliculata]|uniref:uncharacterized protein LOC112571684 isoform X2 n=1 Tax=Pomacea canaliculata TaxID=400727 RepID=UPI000D737504|nr:uncharacterized protein LOC112571684 isoform X2 [Pomacea canaliculata]